MKRSDSWSSKKRHGSGKQRLLSTSMTSSRRRMAPFKEEDLNRNINDRYWGITLPANLDLIFTDPLDDPVDIFTDAIGLTEAVIITPTSPGTFEYHSNETCLKCYSFLKINNVITRHRSSSLTHYCSLTPSVQDFEDSVVGSKSTKGSPLVTRKRHISSEDSILETVKVRLEQRKEALKVISTLNATVGASRAEEILLRMKQASPMVFKDLCFYSEVCQLMSNCSFRLVSRRFVQELFMDVSYEILSEDVRMLLKSHNNYNDNCNEINTRTSTTEADNDTIQE